MPWRNPPRPLSAPPASPRARKQLQRSELKRKTPLRAKRHHLKLVDDPAREAWKSPVAGVCGCGCGTWAARLERHHVLQEQYVKRADGPLHDLRNSILLAPDCHRRHTDHFQKLPFSCLSPESVWFAIDLLGIGPATNYFVRMYDMGTVKEIA